MFDCSDGRGSVRHGVLCAPVHLQTHRDGTGPDKDEEQLKKTINSGQAAELFASRSRSSSLLTGAVIRRVIATAHKRLAENEMGLAGEDSGGGEMASNPQSR